ncbi:hypothetical protein P154DRAFT_522231 [Amniculicola lignicola CBS 123094]|uniref:BRCT domain-containing protein n=1 Tax=Amniculicola lignicola CBS 123094 TaxID=1392246 RepID=A0A6A5WJI9_9PLEO|nr:hypothetical protein P154DRAFT_522231 [Amniculicola lignicola CBS 123094]
MGWLLERSPAGNDAGISLQNGRWYHLVSRGDKLSVVLVDEPDNNAAVGCVFTGSWGVKLQAGTSDLCVKPAHPEMHIIEPYSEEYLLKRAEKNGCYESILLRNKDSIFLPGKAKAAFTMTWTPSEVLVNSSENADAEVPESEDVHEETGQGEGARESSAETEDEEDLDRTIGPTDVDIESRHAVVAARNTPVPSVPRTQIVQETPTTERATNGYGSPPNDQLHNKRLAATKEIEDDIPPTAKKPEQEEIPADDSVLHDNGLSVVANADGTENTIAPLSAPLKDKRPSPEIDDEEISNASMPVSRKRQKKMQDDESNDSMPVRSGKRVKKTEDDGKTSDASTPAPPIRRGGKPQDDDEMSRASTAPESVARVKPVTKRKSRAFIKKVEAEEEPDVENSIEQEDNEIYTGPKPRVAFSNSTIADNSMFVKFLKSNGGKTVESIKNSCNILCVRDGPLRKSMKLLSSIALGIPIVSDKWLKDSATRGVFLPLQNYVPSVPEQETEWNFSMSEIWSTPQSDLFNAKIIYFTLALRATYERFAEVEHVCKAAGAKRVISKPGKDVQEKDAKDTIILAIEQDDDDAIVLAEKGMVCYSKDLLTLSILRGDVDLHSEEFKLKLMSSQGKKKGRGRARKS